MVHSEKSFFKNPVEKISSFFWKKSLKDHEFQYLFSKKAGELKNILSKNKKLKSFLQNIREEDLKRAFSDLGGHDFPSLISALEESKKTPKHPTLIIAHTIKGWGFGDGRSGRQSLLHSFKKRVGLSQRGV